MRLKQRLDRHWDKIHTLDRFTTFLSEALGGHTRRLNRIDKRLKALEDYLGVELIENELQYKHKEKQNELTANS